MERCLIAEEYPREKLQLLGFVCFMISVDWDYNENISDEVSNMINLFDAKDIVKMQRDVVKTLNFDLIYSTSHDFINFYFAYTDNDEVRFLANILLLLLTLEEELYYNFLPHDFAAACINIGSNYLKMFCGVHTSVEVYKFKDKFKKMKINNSTKLYTRFNEMYDIELVQSNC